MRLLIEVFKRVLVEGRKEDALKKYPGWENVIEKLVNADPSGTNKYLDWGMKQITTDAAIAPSDSVAEVIKQFHKRVATLQKKDINAYSYTELADILSKGGNSKREERKFVKGNADTVFEDDQWLIIHPRSKDASCFYGKGTKWCTAASKNNAYTSYAADNNFLFYIIDKTAKSQDPLSKMAAMFSVSENDEEEDEYTREREDFVVSEADWYDSTDTIINSTIEAYLGSQLFFDFSRLMKEYAINEEKTEAAEFLSKSRNWTEPVIRDVWSSYVANHEFQKLAALHKNTPDDLLLDLVKRNYINLDHVGRRTQISPELMSALVQEIAQSPELWKRVHWKSLHPALLKAAIERGAKFVENLRLTTPDDEPAIDFYASKVESYKDQLGRILNNLGQ